ncbi:MAG: hydroxymethylglutaryl-CoA reductase, degradative [Candidatus Heimdallarchaeota archaeon]|nr:hydroxymethylglutaryl-CoA reductase, degradative [Candidatus Heimdallarchaeota archaeon]MCK4876389.1 hydroxymethylglutaryl-CoA reductase, degradative [Candidatus Heimdallarchaeota archaeon]
MTFSSRIPNFYNLTVEERRNIIAKLLELTEEEITNLEGKTISDEALSFMIENVVGRLSLPLGIATNFIVNGKEYLVPMAIEETSVVAAASHAAKIVRKSGGFKAEYSGSFATGQIQVLSVHDFKLAEKKIQSNISNLLEIANSTNKILTDLGGGAKDIEIRRIKGQLESYLVLHLIVDVKDAMGANAVNTMLEALKPEIEKLTGGTVLLRIISNLSDKRYVKVEAVFDKKELGGENIVDKILLAYDLADHDPYRCATHNKGIMNGIIAVLLATGNDTRAVEAGAHVYATKDGGYKSLTKFTKNNNGDLFGCLEIPLSIGVLGGAINMNPTYKAVLKILGVSNVEEFACVVAAVGLAQNVAALRALVSEGIQSGHMTLHARNIAINAGAKGDKIEEIAQQMIEEEKISFDRAKDILDNLNA